MTELHFDSLAALAAEAEAQKAPISAVVLAAQARSTERSQQALYEQMRQNLAVMRESVRQGLAPGVKSASGLSGGDAHRMAAAFAGGGAGLCGPALCGALAKAVAVAEWNAAMGRIVAAPTAGSCGILPAAVLGAGEALGLAEEPCVMALFCAAGVGQNDPQPKERVKGEIVHILNKFLPESYDREIFLRKSTLVFDHIVDQAMTGYNWVA